jgi:asparagine synthase (glutamine-hydrolysing)
MCGIAGILDLKGRAVEQPVLERLCACLAYRGPDDEGFHVEGNGGLGQRRLSIIDLSSGRQPTSRRRVSKRSAQTHTTVRM